VIGNKNSIRQGWGKKKPKMGVEPKETPAFSRDNQQIPPVGAVKAPVAAYPPVPANPDLQAIIEA
jgi:hypothetical protein